MDAHFAGRVEEQCGNAHFVGHSSRRERTYRRASGGCSARRKISSGTTIGIVHTHFVGRSKIDLTSISDPKMFGMCRTEFVGRSKIDLTSISNTKMFGMCRIQYGKEISYLYPTKKYVVSVGYNPNRKSD